MDEAAFIENNLLEVFKPLATMKGTFIVMLSSPNKDPTHWFMVQLKKKKPDGTPVTTQVNFDLVCKDCAKLPFDKWSKCNHVKMKVSRLKDKRKKRKHQEMSLLDEEAEAAEELGHIVTTKHAAFNSSFIDDLFDKKNWVDDIGEIKFFLMAHDPNGMGWDDGAISVMALNDRGEYVLIWLSIENTGDWKDQKAFIKDNVRLFYTDVAQYYENVPIICAIECINTPLASDFQEWVDYEGGIEFSNVHVIVDACRQKNRDEKRRKIPGVWLSYTRKYNFVKHMNIAFSSRRVKMWKGLGTSHYKGPKFVRRRLEDQLRTFIHFADNPKYGENGKRKRKNLTGKIQMKKDDACLCFIMNRFWIDEYGQDIAYLSQRQKAGLER